MLSVESIFIFFPRCFRLFLIFGVLNVQRWLTNQIKKTKIHVKKNKNTCAEHAC